MKYWLCCLFSLLLLSLSAQSVVQDANLRLRNGNLQPTTIPSLLEYKDSATYKLDGSPVTTFEIRSSRRHQKGLNIVGFYCQRHSLYWINATGTILDFDLWYGPLEVRSGINGFKIALESGTIKLRFPTKRPRKLKMRSGYDSVDPVNNPVEIYEIQTPPPGTMDGISITAYYFPRQNIYWLHKVGGIAGFNLWYGPFTLGQTQQSLELMVRLNKFKFFVGQPIQVQVIVKNNSNFPQILRFSSGLKGDYRIDSRFRWSENRFFTQAFTQVTVPAYSEVLLLGHKHTNQDFPLSPGNHSIVGIAKTTNLGRLRSQPVTFSVVGGDFNVNQAMTKAVDLITKRRYAEAIILLQRIISFEASNNIAHYNLACAYALSNQIDRALNALEDSFRFGYTDFTHAWVDSDLSNIHNHPRFKMLLRKYDPNHR